MIEPGLWEWLAKLSPAQATLVASIVGSVLGFGTLTAGALFNAHLNRRRDERLAEVDRLTLLRGLATEITVIRDLLAHQLRIYRNPSEEGNGSSISPKIFSALYQASIQKLSSMPPKSLTKTMVFHTALDEYEYNLRSVGCEFPDHGPLKVRSFNYPHSSATEVAEHAERLHKAAVTALDQLETDIGGIEKKLRVPPSRDSRAGISPIVSA